MSRIWESCVSSEDIKHETGADKLFGEDQIGISIMIEKNGEWIGYIDCHAIHLGGDHVIRKIVIYKDEKRSQELTTKYLGKILIPSVFKDHVN